MSNPQNLGLLGSGPHSHSISETVDPRNDLPAGIPVISGTEYVWSPNKGTILAADNNGGAYVLDGAGGHIVYHGNGTNGMGHTGHEIFVIDNPISIAEIKDLNVVGTEEPFHGADIILIRGMATPDGHALDSMEAWQYEVAKHNIHIESHDTGQVDKIGQHIQETDITIHGVHGVGAFASVQAHDVKLIIDHTGDAGADGSHLPLYFAEPAVAHSMV